MFNKGGFVVENFFDVQFGGVFFIEVQQFDFVGSGLVEEVGIIIYYCIVCFGEVKVVFCLLYCYYRCGIDKC